jgi:hypothetical protein
MPSYGYLDFGPSARKIDGDARRGLEKDGHMGNPG